MIAHNNSHCMHITMKIEIVDHLFNCVLASHQNSVQLYIINSCFNIPSNKLTVRLDVIWLKSGSELAQICWRHGCSLEWQMKQFLPLFLICGSGSEQTFPQVTFVCVSVCTCTCDHFSLWKYT